MIAVDIAALAQAATAELVPSARQKQIDLGFEADDGAAMITGNRLLLHELLVNLVDNAIRYTPAGGEVTVRVRRNHAVTMEVEDDGPGIPADERDRVFERFYRGRDATQHGSGLGLAIARDICHSHGARIDLATPDSGKGLRVRVTFGVRQSFEEEHRLAY